MLPVGIFFIGIVHLGWTVSRFDSTIASHELLEAYTGHSSISWCIDYEVIQAIWFDTPQLWSGTMPASDRKGPRGDPMYGSFQFWAPVIRAVNAGQLQCIHSVAFNLDVTRGRLRNTILGFPLWGVVKSVAESEELLGNFVANAEHIISM